MAPSGGYRPGPALGPAGGGIPQLHFGSRAVDPPPPFQVIRAS